VLGIAMDRHGGPRRPDRRHGQRPPGDCGRRLTAATRLPGAL